MKTSSSFNLRNSIYPLPVMEENQKEKTHLHVVKREKSNDFRPAADTIKSTEDPANWDETWFNNYE